MDAFRVWEDGGCFSQNMNMDEVEADYNFMKEVYMANGRWMEGWYAAHEALIEKVMSEPETEAALECEQ